MWTMSQMAISDVNVVAISEKPTISLQLAYPQQQCLEDF